jgi:hypothetical protein
MATQATANITLIASENMTPFHFCAVTSAGTVEIANDAAQLLGVIAEEVLAGESVPVMTAVGAVVDIELAGTLAAGARVMSNSAGEAIASATAGSTEAGTLLVGGDDGDIVAMLFQPLARHAA